jgi:hypothetical protein
MFLIFYLPILYVTSLSPDKEPALLPFTAVYFACRVSNEPAHRLLHLLLSRWVAKQLYEEIADGLGLRDYVRQLCSVAVNACGFRTAVFWRANQTCAESNFEINVFVTAIYTKTTLIVEK